MSFNDGFSTKSIPVPSTAPVSGNVLVYDGTAWVAGAGGGGGGTGDITSVTAGTNLTGGGTSGDVTVSLGTNVTGLTNLQATSITGSFSGNLIGTASFATTAATASSAVYGSEWHVSTGSGNDVTGNGTLLNPYRTLGAGIAAASGFGGDQIVLHPGSYFENVTMDKGNTTICAAQGSNGGEVNFSGTMTISQSIFPNSSIRLFGIAVNNLIHNGIGSLYVDTCKINDFTKITNTYCEINDSDINTSLTVNGAGTLQINSGKQTQTGTFTINNLSAIVSVKNSMNCTAPIVTQGYFAAEGSNIFAKATGYAVSASAFTIVELNNCYLITPVLTRSSASLQGQYSITNVIYNKAGSILGTSLNLTSDFQNIRSDNITGSISGTNAQFANAVVTTLSASTYLGLPTSSGGTPGGTNTTVQFNSGSTFSGSTNLVYDYITNILSGTTAQFATITASYNLIQGDLRVLGTASITQLNTIGQTSLLVGDKYITILSGGVDHSGIDGAGFLWGTSSDPGETTGTLGEHAHVLYNASIDSLQVFPGLYVAGNASVSGNLTVTGSITELSTRKIKTNIQTVYNQLSTISKLNPVSYVRLDDGRKEYGFISEEVKEVYPEFVVGEGISYPKMVSILVSAVKELTDKLEKQQSEIEILKNTRGNL